MSLGRKIIDFTDSALDMVGQQVKQSIADYCDLETADIADSDFTLVSKDGSLLTIMEIGGVRQLVGGAAFYNQIVQPLSSGLQTLLESSGHAMQFWFEVDPDETKTEIDEVLAPSYLTAQRLGLDMEDLLRDRSENMLEFTNTERCYLVLWTRPSALTKKERQQQKEIRKKLNSNLINQDLNAQDLTRAFTLLRNDHRSYVEAVKEELNSVGVMCDKLDSHSALRQVRKSIAPGFTDNKWKPLLPGDQVYPSVRKRSSNEETWEVMWPPLSWQLAARDAHFHGENMVEIGDRIFAPIYIELFPRDFSIFGNLFVSAHNKGLPWRMSYLIEGGGMDGSLRFKGMLAGLMGWAGANNKMLSASYKALEELRQRGSENIVSIRMMLCTWAPKHSPEILARRVAELARTVEGWGSCQVSEVTGDPLAGVASSALAFTEGSIATKSAAPLSDALIMAPLSRPCSPWNEGAVTFRSPDGKLMPYQPYSSKQNAWINLIFAKPGSGKSVLMSMNNLALCLAPGIPRLPRIAIIDIGPSSSGLISLLKEALPANRRHLVTHRRLRMIQQDSINPFDTQLGCRYPTTTERSFLINLVTLLATDPSKEKPYDGITGVVQAAVDEVYRDKSDRYHPNLYASGLSSLVDDAIRESRIRMDINTTWWEVVDGLFAAGYEHAAHVAQRYAVPLLKDIIKAANTEKIRAEYGDMRVQQTHELVINAFGRLITEALRMIPILANPTNFDLGEARVVALDLDEVAKGSGVIGDRVTAVMYMLARQVTARDYYLTEDFVNDMPAPAHVQISENAPVEKYKAYHLERIQEIRQDPKRICYDEFHRTAKAEQVREQVVLDMREGRKWQVDIMLASQDLGDFDKNMVNFATGVFVMDGGNAQTVNDIATTFGFQDEFERRALETSIRGPRRGGGVFLAKFDIKSVWYTMLLSAPLGSMELWAFSTTTEDAVIRNRLYEKVGPRRARQWLARAYPGGSAKSDVESRRQRLKDSTSMLLEGESDNVIDQIIQDVMDMGMRMEADIKRR